MFCQVDKCGSESRFKEHHVQNNRGEEMSLKSIESIHSVNIGSISWDFGNKGQMIHVLKQNILYSIGCIYFADNVSHWKFKKVVVFFYLISEESTVMTVGGRSEVEEHGQERTHQEAMEHLQRNN